MRKVIVHKQVELIDRLCAEFDKIVRAKHSGHDAL